MTSCRAIILYWLNCIVDTNQVTEGHMLASSGVLEGCHQCSPGRTKENPKSTKLGIAQFVAENMPVYFSLYTVV
jgi:hypothetical protein